MEPVEAEHGDIRRYFELWEVVDDDRNPPGAPELVFEFRWMRRVDRWDVYAQQWMPVSIVPARSREPSAENLAPNEQD